MTVPMMRRAALSGWQNAYSYPNALTTGPAAGGYTPNTAVTIATATAINNTGNPSWVSTVGTTLYVQNVNFYLTGGDITVNATTAVTFQGCTFSSSLPASNSGQETLVLSGGGTYTFEYCSMFGSDGTGATRVNEIIDMGADCVIVIDHCNMYNMRQAVDIRDNASAGVTITNSYLHDIVLFTQAPAQPVLTILGTGGSMTAGTYGVVTTYTGPAGESIASPASAATTSGTTSTITITSPPASTPTILTHRHLGTCGPNRKPVAGMVVPFVGFPNGGPGIFDKCIELFAEVEICLIPQFRQSGQQLIGTGIPFHDQEQLPFLRA